MGSDCVLPCSNHRTKSCTVHPRRPDSERDQEDRVCLFKKSYLHNATQLRYESRLDSARSFIMHTTTEESSILSYRDRISSPIVSVDLVDDERSIFDGQNMGWSFPEDIPCPSGRR
jgi:hypothetical protein